MIFTVGPPCVAQRVWPIPVVQRLSGGCAIAALAAWWKKQRNGTRPALYGVVRVPHLTRIQHRVSSGDFEWATLLGAELARRAAREGAHWFIADPSSDWFHQVAWDLAVAVLRPGGQDIAVLAATDTDRSRASSTADGQAGGRARGR